MYTRWRKKHDLSISYVIKNDDKYGSLHDLYVTISYVERTELYVYLFRLIPYTGEIFFILNLN
jgi:hypothetical protein